MADGCHFENRHLRYLHNRSTDFDEILHGNAHWSSGPIITVIRLLLYASVARLL